MEWLWQIEISITLFFQSLGDWLAEPFRAISFLGTENFIILLLPLVYWCINSTMGMRMAIMLVLSDSTNNIFKKLCHSPRPFWFDSRVKALSQETSFGLPSGHSQNSASLWGMMAASAKKKWLTAVAIVVIFLVGISRIYLGMHFTRDVLTGWLLGALLIGIYFLLEKPVAKWLKPKKLAIQILYAFLFSVILILLGTAANLTSLTWQMPTEWIETAQLTGGAVPDPFNVEGTFTLAGVSFGFLSGYAWWWKKYGQPVVEGNFTKRFFRFIVGIIGLLAIYLGLKLVFPESPILLGLSLRFVRYAVMGLWVSAIGPWIFKKMKLDR